MKAWRILRQSLQHSGDEEFNASMRAQLIEYLCEQLQKLSRFVIQQNDCLENVEDLDEQQLNAFLVKYQPSLLTKEQTHGLLRDSFFSDDSIYSDHADQFFLLALLSFHEPHFHLAARLFGNACKQLPAYEFSAMMKTVRKLHAETDTQIAGKLVLYGLDKDCEDLEREFCFGELGVENRLRYLKIVSDQLAAYRSSEAKVQLMREYFEDFQYPVFVQQFEAFA